MRQLKNKVAMMTVIMTMTRVEVRQREAYMTCLKMILTTRSVRSDANGTISL
jgi:hypothetical protein